MCEFQKQINEIIHTNVALVFISCDCSVYKLTHNIFIAVKFQIYFVGLKNQVFVRLMTISASLKYICIPSLCIYIHKQYCFRVFAAFHIASSGRICPEQSPPYIYSTHTGEPVLDFIIYAIYVRCKCREIFVKLNEQQIFSYDVFLL